MSKQLDNSADIILQGTSGLVSIEAGTTPGDYSFILPPTGGLNTDILTSSGANNQLKWTTLGSLGGGSVTSVAMTTPAFLTTTGSPITTTGTLAITLSGSALPVTSGGTGTLTSTGSGSTVLSDNASLTTNVTLPKTTYLGTTSGSVTIIPQPVAGNYNFNLPATVGTSGQVLTSAGGFASPMTWTTPSTTTLAPLTNIPSGTTYNLVYNVYQLYNFIVTGSGGGPNTIFQLPIATTLTTDNIFYLNNNATSNTPLDVKNNAGTILFTVQRGSFATLFLVNNTTSNGVWDWHYAIPSNSTWNTTSMTTPATITTTVGTNSTSTTTGSILVTAGGGIGSTGTVSAPEFNACGSTSGIIKIKPQTTAGTYNFNLPTSSGTSGQVLTSAGGVSSPMTWTTLLAPGTGSVTSVALTTPSFLTTSGSPITTSGTLDITLSGTALPILNGGTGTTTSTGSGSTVLSDNASLTTNVSLPKTTYLGSTSGSVTIIPQPVAGNYNFNLPATVGTSGQVLTSAGGFASPMTWTTPLAPGTGTVTSVAMTTPSFLTTSGSPITTTGTLDITLSGSALPVTSGGTGTTTSTGSGSTVLSDNASLTTNVSLPKTTYLGSTSGSVTIIPQPVAGNYNYNLPTSSGTAGQYLTSGGGGASPMTWATAALPGTGTVTSVAMTTPSFLTTTGSPITASGTLAITLSGTALPVTSGGTGTTTSTGTGSTVLNTAPTFVSTITTPHLVLSTANVGPIIETQQSFSGNASFQYFSNFTDGNVAYFGLDGSGLFSAVTGAAIVGTGGTKPVILIVNSQEVSRLTTINTASTSTTTGTLTVKGGIGATGTVSTPSVNIQGSASGVISILPQSTAGTYNFNLPTSSGTAGDLLVSGGGGGSAMTWNTGEYTFWTPTITGIASNPSGLTYTIQTGKYVKIGSQVTVTYSIVFDYTSSAISNGIRVSNLPFAASGGSSYMGTCSNRLSTLTGAGLPYITEITDASTNARVYSQGGTTTIAFNIAGASAQAVYGSFTYLV